MKKIILIGGAPTVGKSFTAKKIAQDKKIPWIGTDTIREQMRRIVQKTRYPHLFLLANPTPNMATQYLSEKSPREIVAHQNAESKDVWRGVKALLDADEAWDTVIIEGVAVLPSLVKQLSTKVKEIKVVFLIDDDVARIRRTIFKRGLWDNADTYPDRLKEKEVAWVLAFNKYILKEAKKYGYPVVYIGNRKDYIKQVKKCIT